MHTVGVIGGIVRDIWGIVCLAAALAAGIVLAVRLLHPPAARPAPDATVVDSADATVVGPESPSPTPPADAGVAAASSAASGQPADAGVAVIPGAASGRRSVAIVLGVAAVLLVAAAAVLLAPARYALTVPRQGQIVAAPGSRLKVEVRNAGLLSGTLRSAVTLDGASQGGVHVAVSARGSATVDLALPGSLSPGKHVAMVAGQTLAFTALRPADFHVASLVLAPTAAKVHTPVVVIAEVSNRGEATGVFAGVLDVDGHAAQSKPVKVAGGASTSVSYQFTRATPGRYVVRLGDSPRSSIAIVKPFRPANGAVLARSSSGPGRLTFQNQMHEDCVAVLTTDAAGGRHPSLAFYVRSRSSATVTGIGDGKLYVYFTSGTDWNRTMRDFLTTDDRERFKHAAVFSTSSWTSSYTDWSAWTVYTTQHTEYTGWTIKVSDDWVWGPKGGTIEVGSSRFPKV